MTTPGHFDQSLRNWRSKDCEWKTKFVQNIAKRSGQGRLYRNNGLAHIKGITKKHWSIQAERLGIKLAW